MIEQDGVYEMDTILELFKLDVSSLTINLFIIMSGSIAMFTIIGKFSEIIGKPVKWIRKKDEEHALLLQTSQGLKALQDKHKEAVSQSIRHDEMIKDSVSKLSQKVDTLSDIITEMRRIQDEDKLAEYKDKIGQSYRYYCERKYSSENPIVYWNSMEKEALEGLIEQYEAHGGKNSFVHSVVEPEIQKWRVIDE